MWSFVVAGNTNSQPLATSMNESSDSLAAAIAILCLPPCFLYDIYFPMPLSPFISQKRLFLSRLSNCIELGVSVLNHRYNQHLHPTSTTASTMAKLRSERGKQSQNSSLSSKALKFDGRTGEGGGQVVRLAVCLAALTGTHIKIENVRGNRPGKNRGGEYSS